MKLSERNTAWDFKENPPEIGILPLACFEPHSENLPLGTDAVIMSAVGKGVDERLAEPSFLLPLWPYGNSGHLSGQSGTIALEFLTLWHVVRDLAISLHERGIHKVVVLNNHGSAMTTTTKPIGNFVVKTAVRQLNYEVPGLSAIWVQPFAAGRERLAELFESAQEECHVGAVELSLLQHLLPDREIEVPADFVPEVDPAYLHFDLFTKFSPNGVWGRPSEASPEKGEQALAVLIEETTRYIQETYQQLAELSSQIS